MTVGEEKLFKIISFYPQSSEETDFLVNEGFMDSRFEYTGKASVFKKEFIEFRTQTILNALKQQGNYFEDPSAVLSASGLRDMEVLEFILIVLAERGLVENLETGDYRIKEA